MWPPSSALSLAPTHFLEGMQHVDGNSLQPTPAPLPIEELWGCCIGNPPIAAAATAANVPLCLRSSNTRAMGVSHQQPSCYTCRSFSCRAAMAVATILLQMSCSGISIVALSLSQHLRGKHVVFGNWVAEVTGVAPVNVHALEV